MLFNADWTCRRLDKAGKTWKGNLPYDAMFEEGRSLDNPSGKNGAYFEGGDYLFEKDFPLEEKDQGKEVYLLFGSVYKDSVFRLSGIEVQRHSYGYTPILLKIGKEVRFGENNHLEVEVHNSDQPNSRWYTGTGILQDVHLFIKDRTHFLPFSTRITTLDEKEGRIRIESLLSEEDEVQLEILDEDKILLSKNLGKRKEIDEEILLPDLQPWSPDSPKLYTLRLCGTKDVEEKFFGLRTIKLDKEKGLLLNGKRVLLLGCCLHLDEGLLGGAIDDYAERRKARLIKKAGYNAVRAAHNPISKAFLEEADRIGLLVLDEYVDCWYTHKTAYDYASHMLENYPEDLKAMVDKDYNHPSVILYSIGNEVGETSEKKGIELAGKMVQRLHELDTTRPITCGINVFFNGIAHTPFTQYSDKKAKKESEGKKSANSSAFFNNLADLLGADFMKTGAMLPIVDKATKDAFGKLDIAGYNYGIKRYRHDLAKYPERFLLGTETFASDARYFYRQAMENNRVLGDFVWAGMDYLGEVGIGAKIDMDKIDTTTHPEHFLTAGAGRLDILGETTSEMLYTRVAFELDKIHMAVIPPKEGKAKHTPSAWRFSHAHPSIAFHEKGTSIVEVYCLEKEVALYQDGKLLARKKTKENGRAKFKVKDIHKDLTAKGIDGNGKVTCEETLLAPGKETRLKAYAEEKEVEKDGLLYLHFDIVDEKGLRWLDKDVEVTILDIQNASLLAFGNSCPVQPLAYRGRMVETYYGTNMAILRPLASGTITIQAKCPYGEVLFSIKAK